MKKLFTFIILFICSATAFAENVAPAIDPSGTYMYTRRDSCNLFLDVYEPAKDSERIIDGKTKPTILFVFGGGFISGRRNDPYYTPWFKKLTEDGYRVVSIDYRLGLKGVNGVGIKTIPEIYNAIEIGVEDLYSATTFLCNNAEALNIDPSNIVICGSSAGAIICLQADWHLSNEEDIAQTLPVGFRYKGVISYSGAVFSREGKPRYKTPPAPTLFFHGTSDKIVKYNKIWFFKNRFGGASYMAKIFKKNLYLYSIYRFSDAGHEIAAAFTQTYDMMTLFLERNIMKGENFCIDRRVDEQIISPSKFKNLGDLYD